VFLLTGLYALLWLAPKTKRDLRQVLDAIHALLLSGELTREIGLQRPDMIGRIAERFDDLTATMRATLQNIANSSFHVGETSRAVTASVVTATRAASVQNEATATSAAAIEQVTVAVGEVSVHAASTSDTSRRASEVAQQGARRSIEASRTIEVLAETVNTAAQQVETLSRQSAEISRITGVIKDVADQTNLLALNAAIEAARAGEQGRGFAVVADEVRKLAERTTGATVEIARMIGQIQQETGRAVEGMRNGASQVKDSVLLVRDAQTSLEDINQHMADTMRRVADISHSASEQEKAMNDLSQNIARVAEMTEQNAQTIQHTAHMGGVLDGTVQRMHKAVAQYRV
jgi:aerotaxis receptor